MAKHNVMFTAFLLVILSLLVCGNSLADTATPSSSAEAYATITGYVYDAFTGKGVEGAIIYCDSAPDKYTLTSADGLYVLNLDLSAITWGQTSIGAIKEDYNGSYVIWDSQESFQTDLDFSIVPIPNGYVLSSSYSLFVKADAPCHCIYPVGASGETTIQIRSTRSLGSFYPDALSLSLTDTETGDIVGYLTRTNDTTFSFTGELSVGQTLIFDLPTVDKPYESTQWYTEVKSPYSISGEDHLVRYLFTPDNMEDTQISWFFLNNNSSSSITDYEWSIQAVDVPVDAIRCQDSRTSCSLYWDIPSPPAGDYVYQISCTIDGQKVIKQTTIHLLDLPNDAPDGISFPDQLTLPLGQPVTETASILPDGWTLPGQKPFWFIYVYNHGNWVTASQNDYLLVLSDEAGQFTFTGITPGSYTVTVFANIANEQFTKTIPVIVLNEDGSNPGTDFSFSLPDEVTVYKFDGYGLPYQYITVAEFDKYPPDDIVPYWSLQMVDAPADLIYMSDSSGILRWEYAEDYPLGDYIYDVSCTCADNTITKRTTIHLQESPVGSPDGISFPDEIIVPLGESISETASILPDDWSLPGFNLYWNVNDVLFHGEWFEPSENDYLLVSANNQGQYTFTGITAGRYMVEIAANVSYLSFSKTVPIIVLNEDGSEPDAAFSFSLPDEVTVYKFDGYHLSDRRITGAEFDKYPSEGFAPGWSLKMVDAPADLIYMSDSPVILRWKYSEDYPLGDYIYDVSCIWNDEVITKRISIHLQESPVRLPDGISFPDKIIVPLGESISETASLLPDGWSLPGFNLYWNVNDAFVRGEWFDPSENDCLLVSAGDHGQYTFTGIAAGRYMVEMTVNVSYLSFSKAVPVIVLREDGSEPDPGFSFSLPDEITVYKLNEWHLSSKKITEAEIDNYQSGAYAPVWSLQMVDAPANMVRIWGTSSSAELSWIYARAFPVGDYIYDVSCTWNAGTVTKRITIHLQDSPVGAPTGISFPDKLTIPLGETVTETASIMPSGWSLPGWSFDWRGTCYLDRRYLNPSDNDYLVFSSDQDGHYSFLGKTPGVYVVNLEASSNSYFLSKGDIYVTVLNADGTKPEVQFELNLAEEETTVYRIKDDLRELYGLPSVSAKYGGSPADLQWSLLPVSVPQDAIHIAYGYDTTIVLNWSEAYPPAGDYIYEVSCTADERSLSKRFTVHLLDCPDGVPELSFPESITLRVGETITESAHILPEGWRVPDGLNLHWNNPSVNWGSTAAGGENSFLRVIVDDGVYTMTGLEAGYYSIFLSFSIDSLSVYKEIPVLVLNEDGSEPVADYDINVPETLYAYRSADLHLARFEVVADDSYTHTWEWTIQPVSVPEDAIYNGKPYSEDLAPFLDLFWRSDTAPAGDYVYDISCRNDLILVTKRITIHLLDEEPELPSLDSITASKTGSDLEIALHVSGGMPTQVAFDVYQGLDNSLYNHIEAHTASAPALVKDIPDGLYQIVVTLKNPAGSVTRATEFYRISSGKLTAVDGTLTLPASLTCIEEEAFAGIQSSTVICPSTLKEIGAGAFQGSTVTRIEIPASVTSIADTAFSGCSKYLAVVTPSGSTAASWAMEHGYLVELQ